MNKRLAAVAAALAIGAPNAYAAPDYASGNFWYPMCTSKDSSDVLACTSLIMGFAKAIQLQSEVLRTPTLYCLPGFIPYGQMLDIFVKFNKDHPEMRHLDASILLGKSLSEAFPCPKGKGS